MNINHLFFYIHYCNSKQLNESRSYPGKRVTRTLQHHEFIFVKGGKGSIAIGKKRYQMKGTMLFYLPPHIQHTIEIDTSKPGSFLSVHFSYAYINFNDCKWEIGNAGDKLPLHVAQELKDYYQIDDLFKKLVDCWNTKLPGYEFITKTFLQQLFIAIYQNIKKHNQNNSTSLKVEKIIKYMHQNINKRVALTDLSQMVNLSSPYLSRTFKETTGYSVIEYFNKIKIDMAKELLIEGNKRVKEVAQALGFTDEFYFSRIFKRIEGISPSEYCNKNVHGV